MTPIAKCSCGRPAFAVFVVKHGEDEWPIGACCYTDPKPVQDDKNTNKETR